MEKIKLNKDWSGYYIVGYHDWIKRDNNFSVEEIEEIKNVMLKKRRPSKRKSIIAVLDGLKTQKKITELNIKYLKRELIDRMAKLDTDIRLKLEKLFDVVDGWEELDKEITEQFNNAVWDICKYSRWSKDTIAIALFSLYQEIGSLYPFDDLKNDYLTVNKGRKIKEIMIYGDGIKYVGVVVATARLVEEKEIEKEIL